MVNGTEAILLSSPPKTTFLKSSKCLSASLESVLSQYHRLSELEHNLEIFQSKLVSIQIRKLRLKALNLEKDCESRLCGFIPLNSVWSFLLLPLVNLHVSSIFSPFSYKERLFRFPWEIILARVSLGFLILEFKNPSENQGSLEDDG